jgi:hypothetical protein
MRMRLGRLWRNPRFLVGLTAFLAAFVVQSGELGSSDTTHRLQATHSFWTSAPAVDGAEDYPAFGIHGRGGRLYGWYGIGQSLLMLPADMVGTYLGRLPAFESYDADPTVRDIFVSYTTSILICVLSALVCFRLLELLGFSTQQRVAGVLALLFCTTFLHYTQNLMENNYIFLLTFTGVAFQYEWLRSGERKALLIGSLALGANLLTRLTTGLDLLAVALFLVLVSRGVAAGRPESGRAIDYARLALPVYAIFLGIDRAYQYYRFGSIFSTYIGGYAHEQRLLNPALPAAFPWETPFHVGLFGALFTPEKSIFLFDPLLVLTAILCLTSWKRFPQQIRAYLTAFGALLLVYICLYSKFTVWSGDFAWGDRYVSTAAQMVALLSVPLLMRHRAEIGKAVRAIGAALIVASVAVQIASVMFWCPLEIYQMSTLGHPTFVVALRMKNILAFILAKMDAWKLTNDDMSYDPWDYQHITAFNFLPFLLARIGKAAGWVVHLVTVIWYAGLAALIVVLILIQRGAAQEFNGREA